MPGGHGAVQPAVVRPAELPYTPAGHSVHAPAPARLYCPAAHRVAVADVDPAGQAYPAMHAPLQLDPVSPPTDPNLPTVHAPLQLALDSADNDPNLPGGQGVHAPAPARLYCPVAHIDCVADVDPVGQAYPALQLPLQPVVLRPVVDP